MQRNFIIYRLKLITQIIATLKQMVRKIYKNLFDDLKNKDSLILIDVGGNIGDYTQMLFENAIKLNGTFQIHVFEPTKYCYSMLSKRFRDKRVYLNNTACSNIDRSAKIYYDSVGSGLASMHNRNLKAIGNELKIKETIKTQRLDDYIKSVIFVILTSLKWMLKDMRKLYLKEWEIF